MDKTKNADKWIGILGIIAMLSLVTLMIFGVENTENSEKQQIIDKVTEKATLVGLEDVVVTIVGKYEDMDCYRVKIDCSNMDELSINEMLAVDKKLREINNVIVCGFTSNGDEYDIDASNKHISKNGEQIYDDYWNSDTHKEVTESENEDYNCLSYHTVTDDNTLGEVWSMAQSFVKDNLKSPKSADFPTYGDSQVSITNSGSYYKVTGYVDAENSFGTEVRATFSLVMKKSGTKYILKECNIYE